MNGLDLKAFRDAVGKQISIDYPNRGPYIASSRKFKAKPATAAARAPGAL